MKWQIAPESRDALKENRTLRCLYRVKFNQESRRAKTVIPWAQMKVEQFCRAFLRESSIGQQPPPPSVDDGDGGHVDGDNDHADGHDDDNVDDDHADDVHIDGHVDGRVEQDNIPYSLKLNLVSLLSERKLFVCFDLFLDDCDQQVRAEINKSLNQPIHLVHRRHKTCHVRRDKKLDRTIAYIFHRDRCSDRGPRPLFSDCLRISYYTDGRRVDEDSPDFPHADDGDDDYVVTEEDFLSMDNDEKARIQSVEEFGAATPPRQPSPCDDAGSTDQK